MIKIKEQLVQANDLELDLHFPEQGVRFIIPSPEWHPIPSFFKKE
jgi:hypothetical protein